MRIYESVLTRSVLTISRTTEPQSNRVESPRTVLRADGHHARTMPKLGIELKHLKPQSNRTLGHTEDTPKCIPIVYRPAANCNGKRLQRQETANQAWAGAPVLLACADISILSQNSAGGTHSINISTQHFNSTFQLCACRLLPLRILSPIGETAAGAARPAVTSEACSQRRFAARPFAGGTPRGYNGYGTPIPRVWHLQSKFCLRPLRSKFRWRSGHSKLGANTERFD